MSNQDDGLFPTELKEPKVESPKLPPLHPKNVEGENSNHNSPKNEGYANEGQLQEAANDKIDQIIGIGSKSNHSSKNSSVKSSKSNSQTPSNNASGHNSQQNSTRSSASANSLSNSAPNSNRPNSSSSSTTHLTSKSCSSIHSPKSSMATKRIGRLPSKKLSYNQEMSKIPPSILHNPHVTKRLNIFPIRNTKPPRAAMSHVEYRNRSVPPMDDLTDKLIKGEKLEEEPSVEQLKNSANILRQYEKDLIEKSQYPEAKSIAKTFDQVSDDIKKKSAFNQTKSGLEELIAKRNELLALADSFKQDWDDKINEHETNTKDHIEELKINHQNELSEFRANIPEELTPLFKRNSVNYLNLRSKEKYKAFNRKFDSAQKLKEEADKIEEFEREANFEKMYKFYQKKEEKLVELQKLSIQNYQTYSDGRQKEMELSRDKSIRGALKRAENIDKQIKRICEEKGIKQRQLNLDIVDEERLEMIKSREKDDPIPRNRVSTGFGNKSRTSSNQQSTRNQSQTISDANHADSEGENESPENENDKKENENENNNENLNENKEQSVPIKDEEEIANSSKNNSKHNSNTNSKPSSKVASPGESPR